VTGRWTGTFKYQQHVDLAAPTYSVWGGDWLADSQKMYIQNSEEALSEEEALREMNE